MHRTHIYGTYTHSMHIETCTPVCTLIHKPSGNRVEHSHFPGSFHLHKGPGSLINESQLMPCCQYSSPTDWETEPQTGQNASCCHHQHHVDVADGWGTPMASDCTEIPSAHHAPGIPPSLAPDPVQTPPLPTRPFLFAPFFLVLQALGQASVLHLNAHTLTHLILPHALTPSLCPGQLRRLLCSHSTPRTPAHDTLTLFVPMTVSPEDPELLQGSA